MNDKQDLIRFFVEKIQVVLRWAKHAVLVFRYWAIRTYRRLYPYLAPSETKFLVLLSILIGLITGVAAYLLDALISLIFGSLIGKTVGAHSLFGLSGGWMVAIYPALGGLAVSLIYRFQSDVRGHGIPEVMRAMVLQGGRIPGRVAFFKLIATALTIGTGGSAGREGPIAHIGAAIGSKVAQMLKMPAVVLRTMAAAGAGAGIAAAFNAPLGGMCFAMEVIVGQITAQPFAMVALSTVVAATVSRGLHGSASYFHVPQYHFGHPAELGLYLVLGITAGIVGKVYVKMLYKFEDGFNSSQSFHERWRPAIGGFLVGVLGIYLPQVLGTGHGVIEAALHNQVPLLLAGILIFAKMVSTSFTLGSGGSGGVFMPSLFIGAMLGSCLGNGFQFFFPFVADPGAFAMVGMAAVFAAVAHAPLTAILILFEMTNDYAIILPVMTATVSAVLVAKVVEAETVYTLRLARQGIVVHREFQPSVLENTLVQDVMSKRVSTIPEDYLLVRIPGHFAKSKHSGFPVLDKQERLMGIITNEEIRAAFGRDEPPPQNETVRSIMRVNVPRVFPGDAVSHAVRMMNQEGLDRIPVVDKNDPTHLVGIITQSDIVGLYGKV